MSTDVWVLVTEEKGAAGTLAAGRGVGGTVTAVVVGTRELADAVAAAGADEVRWVGLDPATPAEAHAEQVAAAVAAAQPRVVLANAAPAARVLLGAAAARSAMPLVPGVRSIAAEGDELVVERAAVGGAVLQRLAVSGPLAGIVTAQDPDEVATPGSVTELATDPGPADMTVARRPAAAAATGLQDADRVVAVGRGLKSKDDLALAQDLAAVIGAEIACTMPIADDSSWMEKERYIGRSGQHLAPRLYLALGISGAPQHMEGVRDAKVVAAVNNDPDAAIFRTAHYGVVGDLYEVVPALVQALKN